MINGIINICKEPGFTSFDVIAKLRGILHQKKIGHTGTLDPEAVGVLPVCLGNATKVCELLVDHQKVYEAVFAIGFSTDTQDSSGTIEDVCGEFTQLSDSDIEKAVLSFKGVYEQLPPMYSAKKVGGRHLYDLARAGETVERKKSLVEILDISILGIYKKGTTIFDILKENEHIIGDSVWKSMDYDAVQFVRIKVCCSKGTYIRTLCHDIGKALDIPACMVVLSRCQVGPFGIDKAYTIAEIEQGIKEGRAAEDYILSVDELFKEYPAAFVNENGMKALLNGNIIFSDMLEIKAEPLDGGCYRIYDTEGCFRAVYSFEQERKCYKSVKMFL